MEDPSSCSWDREAVSLPLHGRGEGTLGLSKLLRLHRDPAVLQGQHCCWEACRSHRLGSSNSCLMKPSILFQALPDDIWVVMRNMKVTMKECPVSIRLARLEKREMPKVGEHIGKQACQRTKGKDVNWSIILEYTWQHLMPLGIRTYPEILSGGVNCRILK